MYSVVLMMALTTGGEMPGHHGRRDGGCCGTPVVASCGCYGGSYGGGRARHHFGRRRGRSGCCGNYGGCCGAPVAVGCGCCGAPVAVGCGCTGGMVGAPAWGGPMMTSPPPPPAGAPPAKRPEAIAPPRGTMAPVAGSAIIIVKLPADAALRVDGAPTTSASAVRTFASPTLQPGKSYVYTLDAELVREGQVLKTSQRVTVRAGTTTQVELDFQPTRLALK